MLMYWEHFKARYLGQKGQGMVEYAVILAFVAIIAASFASDGGLKAGIDAAIKAVTDKLPS